MRAAILPVISFVRGRAKMVELDMSNSAGAT
jgi:hypothetical protein